MSDDKNEPVSRRAFLRRAGASALSTGAAIVPGLAAANAAMQQKQGQENDGDRITGKALADPGVVREDVSYPSGSAAIKATLVRPRNLAGTAPGVIVIHEIFGLNDHIRDVAARLAQAGYVALAPDLYSREGGAPEATDFSVIRAFTAKIADRRMVGDLQAGQAYLSRRPEVAGQKIGTVGFCMGGLYVLLFAAQTPSLGAGVVYYGRPIYRETTPEKPTSPLDLVPRLRVPLQAHYGEADTGIPLADVEALKRAIPATVPSEIYTYKDAPHAFHNDTRESYRAEPAGQAWGRTLAFFKRHLKGA
jgi:carboxymethylenebutenolidase